MNKIVKNVMSLKNALRHNGWKEDRFGHFHKEEEGQKMRVKFQASSVRIEVRSNNDEFWFKRTGEYFGKMKIVDGAIVVGSSSFPLPH